MERRVEVPQRIYGLGGGGGGFGAAWVAADSFFAMF
jgi:hypothetical protein